MSALLDELLLATHGGANRWRECSRFARKGAVAQASNRKVSDGTRTRDHLDHNQELYQLSYAHRGGLSLAAGSGGPSGGPGGSAAG